MLKRLLGLKSRPDAADRLYAHAVAQARDPRFYADLGVADRIDARFELYVLHVQLLILRLQDEGGDARDLAQGLFDVFVSALDNDLRELGVGDLSVAKKMRKLSEQVYGRMSAYESGLKCFEQSDFSGAETQLVTAVASGTLQPDLTEAALRTLARARIAQGKLPEAEETLKQLQAGAMEQDQFLLVTAELELKKNNRDAAKRAVQQARAINSKLAIPASLKGL